MSYVKSTQIKLCAITITVTAIILATTIAMAANHRNNAWSKLDSNTAEIIKDRLNQELCSFTTDDSGRIQATTADKSLSLKADSETIRFDSGKNWFGLKLKSIGRAGNIKNLESPILSSSKNKLSMYYKKQNLTQWYKNEGQSIEHGLVLNKRPAGTGKLNISFAASGNLTPEQNGKDIIFTGAKSINYSGIEAWDTTGKRLPCLLVADSGNISWIIDDAKAQYPITVDPTVSVATALIPTDEVREEDYYGYSVAVSEDTILVGAISAGDVYIFSKNADDNWTQTQKLSGGTYFGCSCAIFGNVAAIGAWGENKVYVYSKTTEGKWVADADYGNAGIISAPTSKNTQFGTSVAISDNTIVIGDPGYAYDDKPSVGTAYVYEADESAPFQLKYYEYNYDAKGSSQFGISVSIYENTIVIGADGSNRHKGSAYIFTRATGGEDKWTLLKELEENDTSYFGHSVAISGDIIVVGSCGATNANWDTTTGSVYILSKDSEGSNNWSMVQQLTPQKTDGIEDTAAIHFGQSVSISGDKIVIGAPGKMENSPGAAYIFAKGSNTSGAEWNIVKRLSPSTDSSVNHKLGYSVNIFQNLVAISRPPTKEASNTKGSVFFYQITDDSTPGGDSGGSETTIPDKIVVPAKDQPSGTSVTIDDIDIKVKTTDELRSQYQIVGMDSMLGSQIYDFSATVTANQLAYFAFNSTSLGERRTGDVKLYKLFTDKNSLQYTYSPDKTPTEEGYFWITDEGNSGQYIDPKTILVGGRSYTINFSILDNGKYDASSAVGTIIDPVAPGLGSSGESGCVLNPDADFSIEWFLLGISIVLLLFRSRYKREN